MGLDMNLMKKTDVKNWSFREDTWEVNVRKNGETYRNIKQDRVKYVVEDVAEWRKANAIHRWFVENVQNGEDDCGRYELGRSELESLLETVNQVLKSTKLVPGDVYVGTRHSGGASEDMYDEGHVLENPAVAERLLPTTEGFFFGKTDYDDYYWENLEYTKKVLEEELKISRDQKDFWEVVYEYQSSW